MVGGVLLFAGLHMWTADTPTPRERHAWAVTLAEMERLALALDLGTKVATGEMSWG
ncbi:hypothetical protein OH768_07340 [Streptomyces sp. NBC_01622]|uniref:hypothetical protein n=1 Tax=Streptomyces sp. NBC_01622 TaxID=2975903 RepID=UPI00386FA415|nr:hypothetical protein OH768_07340 [Streptomyces sp. NBC_01622]